MLFCLLDKVFEVGDKLSLVIKLQGLKFREPVFHFLLDESESVGCGGEFIQLLSEKDLDSDVHNMIIYQMGSFDYKYLFTITF